MNKKNIFIHGCKNVNQLKKTVASLGADHNIYVIGDFEDVYKRQILQKAWICIDFVSCMFKFVNIQV